MKDYRIEVRVKNNILYKLMKGKGIETVAELSDTVPQAPGFP